MHPTKRLLFTAASVRALALAAFCSISVVATAQTPLIYTHTKSALPGELVVLHGDRFIQGTDQPEVWIDQITGSSDTPNPETLAPEILNYSGTLIHVRIPASLPTGVYAMFVKCGSYTSDPVWINKPEPWRVLDIAGTEIDPNRPFRIAGWNMEMPGAASQVWFENTSTGVRTTATVTAGDRPNLVSVTAPSSIIPGQSYRLIVSNGYAGTSGEVGGPTLSCLATPVDAFNLNVPWADDFAFIAANVYNVKTDSRLALHAVGDGVTDDEPALTAACNAATAAGGGCVYLPAGTYNLNGKDLKPKQKVVVRGEGTSLTTVIGGIRRYYVHATAGTMFFNGVADLTVTSGTVNWTTAQATGGPAFVARVNVNGGGASVSGGKLKTLVTDCVFYNTAGGAFSSTDMNNLLVRNTHLSWAEGRISAWNSTNIQLDSCEFTRLTPIPFHGVGFGGWTVSSNDDLTLIDNVFDKDTVGPIPQNNDGETILNEGVPRLGAGYITSATGTTFTDTNRTALFYGPDYAYANAGANSMCFSPGIPAAGDYDVYVRWISNTNRATNAPIDVNHAGGTTTSSVDMTTNGGGWVLLGRFTFNAGTAGNVTVRADGANGKVSADAVQFIPVLSGSTITLDNADTSGVTTTGSWSVSTGNSWSANQLTDADAWVAIVSGTGEGQWRKIVSHTGDTATIDTPWDVTPDSSSGYTVTWKDERWLFAGNIFEDCPRATWLYSSPVMDTAIVGNTYVNCADLYLRADQRLNDGQGRFTLFRDILIADNEMINTNQVYPAQMTCQAVTAISSETNLGNAFWNVVMRHNTINAMRPSMNTSTNNYGIKGEGFFATGTGSGDIDYGMGVKGVVMDRNNAVDLDYAFHTATGACQTTLWKPTTDNVGTLWQDTILTGYSVASIGTVSVPENYLYLNTLCPRGNISTDLDPVTPAGFLDTKIAGTGTTVNDTFGTGDFNTGTAKAEGAVALITVPSGYNYTIANSNTAANYADVVRYINTLPAGTYTLRFSFDYATNYTKDRKLDVNFYSDNGNKDSGGNDRWEVAQPTVPSTNDLHAFSHGYADFTFTLVDPSASVPRPEGSFEVGKFKGFRIGFYGSARSAGDPDMFMRVDNIAMELL